MENQVPRALHEHHVGLPTTVRCLGFSDVLAFFAGLCDGPNGMSFRRSLKLGRGSLSALGLFLVTALRPLGEPQ